jgi:predicted PurR-regulated permease PerM
MASKVNFQTFGLAFIVVFFVGFFLKLARPILIPFFLAVLLGYALSPILVLLCRWRIPRPVAVIAVLVLAIAVVYLVGLIVYSSAKTFATDLPAYEEKLRALLVEAGDALEIPRLKLDPTEWLKGLNIEKIASVMLSALGPFINFMSGLLLVLLFLVFIIAGRGGLERKVGGAFPPREASRVVAMVRTIDGQIQKYLAIKTLMNILTGVLTGLVLALFGVPFGVLFGFLAFLFAYIPTVGSIIVTVPVVLLAFFNAASIWPAFWLLIVLTVINQAIGNILEPRLMGRGLGLSPLLVLFALFFWGWLWGIPGMILAVPILAIIKIVCANVPELRPVEILMEK